MGAKQNALASMLAGSGHIAKGSVAYPTLQQVTASPYTNEIERIYRNLGGVLPTFPVGFRGWDIEFEGMAVELDEELHFNRYRALTLGSSLYDELPSFPRSEYLGYCHEYEAQCLQAGGYGGKWTNPSCEKQFGNAGAKRDLNGDGAPRWKQRAFYDFIKDLSLLLIGVQVVRISIWDTIYHNGGYLSVLEILNRSDMSCTNNLLDLMKTRTN